MNQRKLGILLSYLLLFIKNCIFIVLIPLLIKYIGKEQFGLYNIIGAFSTSLLLIDMGLSNCVVQFMSKYRANKDTIMEEKFLSTILWTYIILALLIFAIGFSILQFLPKIFSNSLKYQEIVLLKQMYILLLFNIVFILISNPLRGIITTYEKFKFLKTIDIFQQLLQITLIFCFILNGKSVVWVVVSNLIGSTLCCLLRLLYVINKIKIKLTLFKFNRELLKEALVYSSFIFLNLIALELYWRTNNIVLGIVTNSVAVAIFSLGSQISAYYSQFSSSISQVMVPKIVRLIEINTSNEKLTDELIKTGRFQLYIVSYVFTAFLLFGKKFLRLWVGSGFDVSYYVAIIIMFPMTILLTQNLCIIILQTKRKHYFRSIVTLSTAIISIIISLILIKHFGIIGAALGTALGLLVGNIAIMNVYYHRVIKINMIRFYRELLSGPGIAICAIIALGVLISKLTSCNWISFTYGILIFTLIYCIITWFVALNNKEKKSVISMLRRQK